MRSVAIYLLLGLSSVVLTVGVILQTLNLTLASSDSLKQVVNSGELAQNIAEYAPLIAEDLQIDSEIKTDAGQTLREPLGTELLQPAIDDLVDQAFNWLESETYSSPKLSLDLASNSKPAIDALSGLIIKHYQALPVCDSNNDTICTNDEDGSLGAQAVVNEITASLSSPEDGLFRVIELAPEAGDQEAQDNLKEIYDGFGTFKTTLPLVVTAWMVISGLAVLISKNHLEGLVAVFRTVALTLTLPVVLAVVFWFVQPDTINIQFETGDGLVADTVATAAAPVVGALVHRLTESYLVVALPLVVAGSGGWFIFRRSLHAKRHQNLAK